MKKLLTVTLVSFLIGGSSAVLEAVPAFARQMKSQCTTCHFQHFPTLNAFGRSFKASGFTQSAQENIEGDGMSIAPVLNASLFMKLRYQKTNGVDAIKYLSGAPEWTSRQATTNMGEVQFPDEFAMLLGGRVAENVGFIAETGGAGEGGAFFLSFKLPIMFDLAGGKIGVIPFFTDGLGVGYGFELFNNAVARNIRVGEHRSDISAYQFTGLASGAASGAALVYSSDLFWVNYSKWAPGFQATALGQMSVRPNADYIRVGVTPGEMGGFDVGIGGTIYMGTTRVEGLDNAGNPSLTTIATEGNGLDVQLQGTVGGHELGIYFTQATANASDYKITVGGTATALVTSYGAETPNYFNSGKRDKTATTVGFNYSVLHNLDIGFFIRRGDNGSSDQSESGASNLATFATAFGVALPAPAGIDLTGVYQSIDMPELTTSGHTLFTSPRNEDNSMLVSLNYGLYQNVHLVVEHSRYSGNAYNRDGNNSIYNGQLVSQNGPWAVGGSGDSLTTFMLEVGM